MNRLNLCLVILWSSFYITFGFGASLKYGQTAKNLQIFEDNLKQTGIRERNTRRGNSATLETHTHTVIGVFKELKKRETVQRQLLPSRENVAHGEALLGRGVPCWRRGWWNSSHPTLWEWRFLSLPGSAPPCRPGRVTAQGGQPWWEPPPRGTQAFWTPEPGPLG